VLCEEGRLRQPAHAIDLNENNTRLARNVLQTAVSMANGLPLISDRLSFTVLGLLEFV
jgi:hypothetical protein